MATQAVHPLLRLKRSWGRVPQPFLKLISNVRTSAQRRNRRLQILPDLINWDGRNQPGVPRLTPVTEEWVRSRDPPFGSAIDIYAKTGWLSGQSNWEMRSEPIRNTVWALSPRHLGNRTDSSRLITGETKHITIHNHSYPRHQPDPQASFNRLYWN